jgi:hypothetical protein
MSRRRRAKRILFEDRKGSNYRDAEVEEKGDLVLNGHDLDSALESFVGGSEWEGELRVEAADVPRVLVALRAAFGPLPTPAANREEELLALIAEGFGGRITCMTRFGEWLEARGIPCKRFSWSG